MSNANEHACLAAAVHACKETQAEIQGYLVSMRSTLSKRLPQLNCPQSTSDSLFAWIDREERALPDAATLAGPLFDPDLGSDQLLQLFERLESTQRACGEKPDIAIDYLQKAAHHGNANVLSLVYWAYLHHPVRDRFYDLQMSLTALLSAEELIQRRQAALIRHNGAARENAITVHSYNTMDVHGDSFGWELILYRKEDELFVETHQWVTVESAQEPTIEVINSGVDLACALRRGEDEGLWEITEAEYREAVESVFEFDEALGIDFLDALHHQYGIEIDIQKSKNRLLKATSTGHQQALEAAPAAMPLSRERQANNLEPVDPISALLSTVKTEQPMTSGMWAGLLRSRVRAERLGSARKYAIYYAQETLCLPKGRHNITKEGLPGNEFWVEYSELCQ